MGRRSRFPGPHLGGSLSLWSQVGDTVVPVAKAPQDPHSPAKCLCLDRREGKLARWAAGIAPVANRRGKEKHSGGGNILGHFKLEFGNSAA